MRTTAADEHEVILHAAAFECGVLYAVRSSAAILHIAPPRRLPLWAVVVVVVVVMAARQTTTTSGQKQAA